jgi:hypothetical protein
MDITNQLQQISILLTQNRLVTILKQYPMPVVPSIVCHSIASQKTAHQSGHGNHSTPYQKMDMVRQQGPGKTGCLRFEKKKPQTVEKGVTIPIVLENSFPLDSSHYEVVHSSWIIDPCFSGHEETLSNHKQNINL